MTWTQESRWDQMEMELAGPACPVCDLGLNLVETPLELPHLECPECGHTEDVPDDWAPLRRIARTDEVGS